MEGEGEIHLQEVMPPILLLWNKSQRLGLKKGDKEQMKKKSIKKTMVIALAGIMLAGSLGWSQLSARAAVNGVNDCSHENKSPEYTKEEPPTYESCGFTGHMERTTVYQVCNDCGHIIYIAFKYGNLEAHDFSDHWCIEDLGGGMYMHRIRCVKCEYMDEVLSDDPSDPKV